MAGLQSCLSSPRWRQKRNARRPPARAFVSSFSGGSAGCGWLRSPPRFPSSCSVSPPATTTSVFARLIDARLHGERAARAAARLRAAARTAPRPVADAIGSCRSAERSRLRAARRGREAGRVRGRRRGAVAIMPRGGDSSGQTGPRRLPEAAAPACRRAGAPAAAAASRSRRAAGARHGAERAADARRAAADRAHRRRARKAPAGAARGDPAAHAAGGARDRGSPLLRASRRRSDRHRRRACSRNLRGKRTYLAGGSTITQQLVRNVFLPTVRRHDAAGGARAIDRGASCSRVWCRSCSTQRASKDEILELYLNDVSLGQRGSFGDPRRRRRRRGCSSARTSATCTLAEAATIAGVIQSPSALSPFNNPTRCQRAAQRRAAGDGRRRLHHRRTRPTARRRSR